MDSNFNIIFLYLFVDQLKQIMFRNTNDGFHSSRLRILKRSIDLILSFHVNHTATIKVQTSIFNLRHHRFDLFSGTIQRQMKVLKRYFLQSQSLGHDNRILEIEMTKSIGCHSQ